MNCWRGALIGLWLTGLSAPPAMAQDTAGLPPVAVWELSARAGSSTGYRDNVLRSGTVARGSAFYMTEAEGSMMRLTENDAYFLFYFFGEDLRYFDMPAVEYEQVFSAAALVAAPVGMRHELGAELSYLYQHQIFDVSDTEITRRRLLVLGHGATARPHWKIRMNEAWSAQLEATAYRQIYELELDDYTEASGRAILNRHYGRRSEARLYYEWMERWYDTRPQTDRSGAPRPDTDLIYRQHEAGLRLKHYWDRNRRWRTLSSGGIMLNRDNGAGFYDYDRLLLRQQLRWQNDRWHLSGNLRGGWYRYQVQQVDNRRRERSYFSADLRAEYRIAKKWQLFTTGERVWNRSNDRTDEYNDWMVRAGAALEL